jgi:hypothetical protein
MFAFVFETLAVALAYFWAKRMAAARFLPDRPPGFGPRVARQSPPLFGRRTCCSQPSRSSPLFVELGVCVSTLLRMGGRMLGSRRLGHAPRAELESIGLNWQCPLAL